MTCNKEVQKTCKAAAVNEHQNRKDSHTHLDDICTYVSAYGNVSTYLSVEIKTVVTTFTLLAPCILSM